MNFVDLKGICWSTQYDLNILSEDCQHTFQAFAEINNETKQEYQIDRTELFTGDIRLEADLVINPFSCQRLLTRLRSRSRSCSRTRNRSLSIIRNDSDTDDENPISTTDTNGQVAGSVDFIIHSSISKLYSFCLFKVVISIQLINHLFFDRNQHTVCHLLIQQLKYRNISV